MNFGEGMRFSEQPCTQIFKLESHTIAAKILDLALSLEQSQLLFCNQRNKATESWSTEVKLHILDYTCIQVLCFDPIGARFPGIICRKAHHFSHKCRQNKILQRFDTMKTQT